MITPRLLLRALMVGALFSVVLTAAPAAQPPGAPPTVALEEQRAAMARLGYMAGEWKGEGWMDMPQGRSHFRGSEIVQSKLAGLALLVEGSFFGKDPATGNEVPVHTTLGVISFDPQTKTFRFKTWLASGTTGERELKLTADGWQWEITSPRGTIRYTTKFAGGEWIELGERSANGTEWTKFFEMRLKRSS